MNPRSCTSPSEVLPILTRIFFGREALTGWLLDGLRGDSRFLAIIGPSGSGKSSLARAGLAAALRQDD